MKPLLTCGSHMAPPAGFEPAPPPPEGGALSPELRGLGRLHRLSARTALPITSCAATEVTSVEVVTDRQTRVLVVDDSATIRSLIAINLWLAGYDVIEARDGQECLELVATARPDLITLDVAMPGLDGFATVGRLRSDVATAGIPIVMVTARAQAADLQRGAALGVDAYLTKPFEPAELVKVVRSLASMG
jgi:CheY-like chemotaxis protein